MIKFTLLKKKTREEIVIGNTELLIGTIVNSDDNLSELEMVQILNNARRSLSDYLKQKKNESLEQSCNFSQKANEIQTALDYID
jgi:hypothetical protein